MGGRGHHTLTRYQCLGFKLKSGSSHWSGFQCILSFPQIYGSVSFNSLGNLIFPGSSGLPGSLEFTAKSVFKGIGKLIFTTFIWRNVFGFFWTSLCYRFHNTTCIVFVFLNFRAKSPFHLRIMLVSI